MNDHEMSMVTGYDIGTSRVIIAIGLTSEYVAPPQQGGTSKFVGPSAATIWMPRTRFREWLDEQIDWVEGLPSTNGGTE